MGAKHLHVGLVLILAINVAACSIGDLKRLAPPGIIKYEDLAKDQPIDPIVEARMEEIAAQKGKSFPVLAEKSFVTPKGINAKTRSDYETDLLEKRETIEAAIEVERALAEEERTMSIEDEKIAVQQAIAQDEKIIAEERRTPILPSE